MKTISFYRTSSGRCPVEAHLDTLNDTQAAKITWVLRLIRETEQIPVRYFTKLANTDDIWEVRVSAGKNIFRLLGFFQTQKTPRKEILLAEKRKKEFLRRR